MRAPARSTMYRWVAVALALAAAFLACSLPFPAFPSAPPTRTAWEPSSIPTQTTPLNTPTPFLACPTPLDAPTLSSLVILQGPDLQLQAGETKALTLGVVESWPLVRSVGACVAWSVEPQGGATITQDSVLVIDPSVPHGSVFAVTADIENGRRLITLDVYIYDLAHNPLIGAWSETNQIACVSQEELPPTEPIHELVFYADGRLTVTWHPFETYVDYWGTYVAAQDGTIELVVVGANYEPSDLDGLGTYSIDPKGDLLLRTMWLGSPQKATAMANCGHRFTRP